jgi:hypothetical protein
VADEEYLVERTVVAKAKIAGYQARKVAWQGRRGAKDHAFFGFGRCVFIEFKAKGKVLIGQQKVEFNKLKALYPDIHHCDNVRDGLRILGIEE